MLHIVFNGEPLPILRIRDGQELEGLGVRQIPKRLGVCHAAEQALLAGAVLPENPHEILCCGLGVRDLILQVIPPPPVGEHGLDLLQPSANLNGVSQDHLLRLPLQRPDLQCYHLYGPGGGRRILVDFRRAAHPELLTQALALKITVVHATLILPCTLIWRTCSSQAFSNAATSGVRSQLRRPRFCTTVRFFSSNSSVKNGLSGAFA